MNFTQYVFGLPQGGIGPINLDPTWGFDDYWAPDYYGNGVSCQGNQQTCLFGLSDFFGTWPNFFKQKREFKGIPLLTHKPSDYINLSGFGGVASDPDLETP